ncbi:hypothetical protein LBMAG56_00800 [Verrucomicrobiota bacterium]|nr:hypothetical protein LBMAG56_00800 [Verrucomicrobiota bacterium]
MLKSKSFLCADFGSGSLKLAEFEANDSGSLRLLKYVITPLGPEGMQESAREQVLFKALSDTLGQGGVTSKRLNLCAPASAVFSKFVKLPQVDANKVTQIIKYEAQQNVPFPLEEVEWDYQILGSTAAGELEVLLVAIKNDVVDGFFRSCESSRVILQLIDAAPAALCNAFRFNYADVEECSMLLDIGAKTSNVLIFEKGKVFSRSINIGANSITTDFSNEAKIPYAAAEKLKIESGFVSLGGAYEEPDDPNQALISKISRQVMTRLHIQMNQTIQFYRGQQGGSMPQRLFLAGGASLMPYTAQFFAEKLNVPVDYFNPLKNIEIGPAINLEEVARVAHSLGEVVGLGIRNLAECPVDLNLIPKARLARQGFKEKQPYFIAAVFSLVLVVTAYGAFYQLVAGSRKGSLDKMQGRLEPLKRDAKELQDARKELLAVNETAQLYQEPIESRYYWLQIVGGLQKILSRLEAAPFAKETATTNKVAGATNAAPSGLTLNSGPPTGPGPGLLGDAIQAGIWIESLVPIVVAGAAPAQPRGPARPRPGAGPGGPGAGPGPGSIPPAGPSGPMGGPGMVPPPNLPPGVVPTGMGLQPAMGVGAGRGALPPGQAEISQLNLSCRARNLVHVSPTANNEFVYAVEDALKRNELFDEKGTVLTGKIQQVDASAVSFTFDVILQLKKPIRLN